MITFQIKGLNELINGANNYKQNLNNILKEEFEAYGQDFVTTAQRLSPINEGKLRSSISAMPTEIEGNSFSKTVKAGEQIGSLVASANYAAYMEFGTKSFAAEYVATLPQEWQEFASSYQGPGGGTFKELVEAITQWVIDKGIAVTLTKGGNRSKSKIALDGERQAAYLIAKKIIIKGVHAHPFMYPSFEINSTLLLERLKTRLNA